MEAYTTITAKHIWHGGNAGIVSTDEITQAAKANKKQAQDAIARIDYALEKVLGVKIDSSYVDNMEA